MNKLRKLTCLLLAMVMVFALAAAASAEGQHTITVPDDGRNYNIYQIFTGDLTEGENGVKVLSNLKWGVNGNGTTGDEVEENTLNALAAVMNGTESEKLTEILKHVTLSNPVATVNHDAPYACADGYYLIEDAGPVGKGEAFGRYLVNVAGDVTLTAKVSKVSFEKKIKDTNDSTGAITGWQDSADYDIGDSVPFQLKGTVAEDFDKYTTYYFAFHDKLEDSLTFEPSSVKVYVGTQEITTGYTVNTSTSDGCTFEVIFNDLKQVSGVKAESEIIVEYTAKLNESAVLGKQGNVNQAMLEYSNNPYTEQKGTTNWDNVIVFTYKVLVNKYANEALAGKELTGAAFKLEKLYKDPDTNLDTWKTVHEFTVDEQNPASSFEFRGLDDGQYKLTETVTPAGFNTIDAIEFTVTADHNITWEGQAQDAILTSLSGDVATGEITFTPSDDQGTLTTNVVNKSGSTLPETGGIGTTLFYVLGGVLVLAAVVLLVTKKRMRSEN